MDIEQLNELGDELAQLVADEIHAEITCIMERIVDREPQFSDLSTDDLMFIMSDAENNWTYHV